MKKLVSLVLVLLLALGSMPIAQAQDEHVVNFVFTKGGFEPPSEDNTIHDFINEAVGITLNHIAPPSANYDEKLAILLVSDTDIDMFKLSNSQFNKLFDYADQGALLDLAPYLQEKLPHVLQVIPMEVLESMMVDGALYGIPVFCSPNRMNTHIRQDWLNNLGLQTPKTLEELHDVLYAFTFNDPDGNGQKDTVGYAGRGLEGLEPLFGAFGFTGVGFSFWYLDEEGNLKPSALHENAPDALKLIRDWYAEGIIDPEIFVTTSEQQINDKLFNNYWGYYYHWWTYDSRLNRQMQEHDPNFLLVTLAPPTGADGKGHVRGVSAINGVVCVMSNTPHLEDSLKLLDWYHTEEGMMTTYTGVRDLHWYQDAEGKYHTLPQFENDATWIQWYSAFESEWPLLQVETYMVQSRRDSFNWNTITNAADKMVTEAEIAYRADLLDYVRESYMKFVTGELDIDKDWDGFAAQWYKMGGQEWYDQLNAQYQAKKK